MDERGQVFTLDMFFALALTALIVSYSGLALEQARRQAEGYTLRYSLERTANDAVDVLLKTLGKPENWAKNAETLETLGFAEENEENPVPNTVSVMKFGQLRRITNIDNWVAPVNASAVEAIKKLFGGSENFEIRILDENENELWHAFPRWDVENSGAENSTEVVTVRRLVAMRYGTAIQADSGVIVHAVGGTTEDNLEFEISTGELDAFDWYIIVRGGGEPEAGAPWPNLKIYVNQPPPGGGGGGTPDYEFKQKDIPEQIYPGQHGGVEDDDGVVIQPPLHEGSNFLGLKFTSGEGWWVRSYVVTIPSCSDWTTAPMMLETLPATLEVTLWR